MTEIYKIKEIKVADYRNKEITIDYNKPTITYDKQNDDLFDIIYQNKIMMTELILEIKMLVREISRKYEEISILTMSERYYIWNNVIYSEPFEKLNLRELGYNDIKDIIHILKDIIR